MYELPFGQGRRFGSGAGPWLDRLIGGWSFDGIARIQSGTRSTSATSAWSACRSDELQKAFKLRFDDAGQADLHAAAGHHRQHREGVQRQRDVRDRLRRQGAPTGRYMAPANGPDCIEIAAGSATAACAAWSSPGRRSCGSTSAR